MCRRRGIWILGLLLVLAACGDNSSLSTASEPEAAPAEAVEIDPVEPEPARVVTAAREVLTAAPWQIVERTGFNSTPVDGLVTFSTVDSFEAIFLEAVPCGLSTGSAIEWNEAGFTLVIADEYGEFDITAVECEPDDDLLSFLDLGLADDQVLAELSADETTATLRRGEQALTLAPVPSDAIDDDLGATTTIAPETTVPQTIEGSSLVE